MDQPGPGSAATARLHGTRHHDPPDHALQQVLTLVASMAQPERKRPVTTVLPSLR